MQERYVDMTCVIGQLAQKYDIPVLSFESLTILGQRAVAVYRLEPHAKRISFPELCEYITAYIQTPFGQRVLKELL